MSFAIRFDATKVKPNTGAFTVLESGEYIVQIVGSDEKPAKNTPGATYYEMVMQVLDGPMKGERVIERLNCKNPNEQAVSIAYGTLSAMCYVTGGLQINTSAELHGIPFRIEVKKVPRNDKEGAFNNEIRRYMDINGNAPAEQAQQAAGVPQQQVQQVQQVQQQPSFQQPQQPSFAQPGPSISQQAQAAAGVPQTPSFAGQAQQSPAQSATPTWAQ